MTLGAKLWRMIRRYLVTIIIVFLLCILSFIIIAGYRFDWTWTGVNPSIGPQVQQYQPGKTLWDWMQLLFVPALLALGAVWFTSRQNHDLQIARAQHQHDIDLTEDNQRETALQGYIDKMSGLLLEKNLRASNPDDEVRKIATAQTLIILPNLDPQRKRSIIKFLHDAGLITKDKAIIDLMEADLSGADLGEAKFRALNLVESDLNFVDLSEANLRHTELRKSSLISSVLYAANLQGADMSEATLFMTNFIEADLRKTTLVKADLTGAWLRQSDLREADLSDAHMVNADLREADLSLAKMERADLTEADLTGAKVTQEQLKTVKSLKDAIMPDGSKHSCSGGF